MVPGYDCLGIALNLYNKFYFEKIDEGIIIEEKEKEYINEDNIVYQSMLYFLKMLNQVLFQKVFKIKIMDNIPICRGLGSSATCIVAGLMGANYLSKSNLNKEERLNFQQKNQGVFYLKL